MIQWWWLIVAFFFGAFALGFAIVWSADSWWRHEKKEGGYDKQQKLNK